MYVNVISDHQAIIKQSSSDHTTTKANSRTLLKKTSVFFYLLFTMICFPTLSKSFFEKNLKLQAIIKRSSSDHQAIIKRSSNYKSNFSNFAQNNFCFFFICYSQWYVSPHSQKSFFEKKFKIANVTMDIQAIIKRSSNYYIFNLICKMKNVKCKMNNLKFKI